MNWRSLLGIDLGGKLGALKRHYKGDWRKFDHRSVWCHVTQWGAGSWKISASTYCSDHTATGFDSRPIAWFYYSQTFLSRLEAEAHLEAEVRRAAQKHPESKFYRERLCLAIENGRLTDPPISIYEYYQDGAWHEAESLPSYRRCEACGHETEQSICPKCGQLVPG
jgi:hypothetical protein